MRDRPAPGHSVQKKCTGCDKRIDVTGREKATLTSIFEGINSAAERRAENVPTPPFHVSPEDYHNKYWRWKKLVAPLPFVAFFGPLLLNPVLPDGIWFIPYVLTNGIFAYYMVRDKIHLANNSARPPESRVEPTSWGIALRMVIPFVWIYITLGLWPVVHLALRRKKYEIAAYEGDEPEWPVELPYREESVD